MIRKLTPEEASRGVAIAAVNFHVTTICNRHCPECSCTLPPERERTHYSLDYIEEHAAHFKDFGGRIFLTGGEPTLHPEFSTIARNLRDWFGTSAFMGIITNGDIAARYLEELKLFDIACVSEYSSPDNRAKVRRLYAQLVDAGVRAHIFKSPHTPRAHRGPNNPCHLLAYKAFAYGELFSCCPAPGVSGHGGIRLTKNWIDEIRELPPPCADCQHSPDKPDASLERIIAASAGRKTVHWRENADPTLLLTIDARHHALCSRQGL